jgi:hypothetical protein
MTDHAGDDKPLSRQEQKEFHDVWAAVEKVLTACGLGDRDQHFVCGESCASNVYLDCFVMDYQRIEPQDVVRAIPRVIRVLKRFQRYWCVRIWLTTTGGNSFAKDTCVWFKIDRYGAVPLMGSREHELFGHLEELHAHYWPHLEKLAATKARSKARRTRR